MAAGSHDVDVALKAAFGGLTWLPSWIATNTSSVAPHLILDDDGVDHKVIARGRHRYDEVASVDFRKGWGTRNIILTFAGTSRTFTGNAASDEAARAGLARLRDKGCALSARARAFLAQS